jgi:multiple sugar transport system ATP-binding protein
MALTRIARRVPCEAMAGVSFEGVTKRFGDVTAVDTFDLEIADREFLVLLGPSGCGKSTVLRMLAGLELPTEGSIKIAGEAIDHVEPRDRDIAMVFQSYALYPHKTVGANIEFPLRARNVPKAERATAVADAAAMLGLSELLDRKPGQLSGGQRQRVALARAVVRDPAVFLMDEPLSNLDAKLRGDTRAELIALHQRLEATILYVTHDQVEAMTMATRVAVMSQGRLQQVGPPQEVYDKPANTFVAGFLGTPPMNLFPPGTVEPGDVIVGVRPEKVRLSVVADEAAAASEGGVAATVVLVEALGHERLVICELEGGKRVVVRAAETPAHEGDRVVLASDPDDRHRFDAGTGERLAG